MSRDGATTNQHQFWRDPSLPFIEARAVQDGRRVCYEKHSHPQFSIGAITGGHSTYINQRQQQLASRGTLVLMNPEEVHACNPIDDQPWSYLMFYVENDWLQQQQEEAGLGPRFRPFDTTASRDPRLYQGLCRLYRQLALSPPEPMAREEACYRFFRLLLGRLTPAQWDDRPPAHLERAAELIRDEYTRPLTLAELAKVAGITPSHLVRSFARHYGMTPHAYLLDRRIRHARQLLRRGMPLAEVALRCGFADQAHFQHHFKRRVAATPGCYRQSLTTPTR